MSKKVKSTFEEYFESMTPAQRKKYDEGFRSLALSEMILAAMQDDEVAAKKLAKMAGVSPTIVQEICAYRKAFDIKSIFKVIDSLGFNLLLERDGETIPLDISFITN